MFLVGRVLARWISACWIVGSILPATARATFSCRSKISSRVSSKRWVQIGRLSAGVGLAGAQPYIPPDVEALRLESLGEDLGPRLVLAIVAEEDVRHAQPRWQ